MTKLNFETQHLRTRDDVGEMIAIATATEEETEAGRDGRLIGRFERFSEDALETEVPTLVPFWMSQLTRYTDRHLSIIDEHTIGKWNVRYVSPKNRDDTVKHYTAIYSFEHVNDAIKFAMMIGEEFNPVLNV